MKRPKLQRLSRAVIFLFVLSHALPAAAAKPGGGAGSLTVTTRLSSESGEIPSIAEGNEVLVFSITVGNGSSKSRLVDVYETVPVGTRYAGGDDFVSACAPGSPAGSECVLSAVEVPGKGEATLTFAVKVDDPVTAAIIDHAVAVPGVDCSATSANDCLESVTTAGIGSSTGFERIGQADWDETSVRKVLHAFAYAGLASDAQIAAWAAMTPEAAIAQMLTFDYTNELLSPAEDASAAHATSLAQLQDFWSNPDDPTNPMRWDKMADYTTLVTYATSTDQFVSLDHIQRAWIQAVNTRGINPFLHKMAFFLTNYHMSVRADLAQTGLTRSYYDDIMRDLAEGRSFTAIIANASKSAAVARRYKHNNNTFNNMTGVFSGNDDFAREYFQLFFRYLGKNEDFSYHEDVNIESNAELLTGMQVDRDPYAYGVAANETLNANHRWVAPIGFTNHVDAAGYTVNNASRHHLACLQMFRTEICGANAADKIDALSAVVSTDPEVMEALPSYVVESLADDRLNSDKIAKIRATWERSNDDLLAFIRAYAISTTFHDQSTVSTTVL